MPQLFVFGGGIGLSSPAVPGAGTPQGEGGGGLAPAVLQPCAAGRAFRTPGAPRHPGVCPTPSRPIPVHRGEGFFLSGVGPVAQGGD